MDGYRTAGYRKICERGGFRYQFFCDLSGALVCMTNLQKEDDPLQAWSDKGRKLFSQCQKCGRWVSDPMHRQRPVCDTVMTADMKFCLHCGVKLENERREEQR